MVFPTGAYKGELNRFVIIAAQIFFYCISSVPQLIY